MPWNSAAADRAVETLVRSGYSNAGYSEKVRPDPVAQRSGLESILRSTVAFEAHDPVSMPHPQFHLGQAHYSTHNNCALLVFQRAAAVDAYRYQLIRISTSARRTRARAHVTNGLLLYKAGDLEGAQAELAIAAEMDASFPPGRYYNATLLAAQARFDEALQELQAAVRLDRRYAGMARQASEFEDLRRDPRFDDTIE